MVGIMGEYNCENHGKTVFEDNAEDNTEVNDRDNDDGCYKGILQG